MITITMRVTRNGPQYIGECLEFPVMTHGRTLEELEQNMGKALALFISEKGDETGCPEEEAIMRIEVDLQGVI